RNRPGRQCTDRRSPPGGVGTGIAATLLTRHPISARSTMSGTVIHASRPHAAAGTMEMIGADPTIADWIRLIRAEYLEMPGLHLTPKQVQRMWGLDAVMCDALLGTLVDVRFLR